MATRIHSVKVIIPILLGFSFVLSACARQTPTTTPPAEVFTPEVTISPTTVPIIVINSTPTILPTSETVSSNQPVGIIVFAMGEAGHQHLFVYHPNYLPITRLTSGDLDDSDPVISPDGNSLAFTSNRSGQWDIYIWDLIKNKLRQLTNSPEFEANPDWSPDNQWITYESHANNQSNILVKSVTDSSIAPIQLTDGTGENISPAWSPLGRQIAFSTNRSGRYEIWVAQLDIAENRFSTVTAGEDADYVYPAWSPDGISLAWEKQGSVSTIETRKFSEVGSTVISIASGKIPFWSPDGSAIMGRFDMPNEYFLTGYSSKTGNITYPLIALSSRTSQFQWAGGNSFQSVIGILSSLTNPGQKQTCQPVQSIPSNQTGRFSLVELSSVSVINPYLSDMADECFSALRQSTGEILGWDFLAQLNNAALPITTPPVPAIPQNWLYTGRAIALNLAPLNAGWMAVSREDFDGQTYWRLWLKCLNQDGSCGMLVTEPMWDFASRASGNLAAFEEGGMQVSEPQGYWVDFTDIALQYSWQRIPSLSNWRTYYPGIQFNTLVYSQSKSWKQAMLELYPEDVISLVEAGK